ncbi:DUF418 domain-containing protein [uncultured Actinomyces sp.]|uniref:DUF418 domain-containing protein n=1 Tax=uncultured Actinomyces sp. TaxID=249061 RepID=UPI0028E2E5B3|nr:DUF418 domain-containing protein [uncultured Actinomyces sp.]
MSTLSFTGERQVRFPAPDVARGFMLALIALANVPFWVSFFPAYPRAGFAALDAMTSADQWWFLVRAMLVDRRAYPLFSILFGFGMVIMARRTIERERRAALEPLPRELSAGWTPMQWHIFNEAVEARARRAASRLIRRRGWWMIGIGAVHSFLFAGDIIGAYGLVAVACAELIVMRRSWLRIVVGLCLAALSLLSLGAMAEAAGAGLMNLEYHGPSVLRATYPLTSFGSWIVSTLLTPLTSLVVPCVMIGVGVARWGALQDPRGHRGALCAIAGGGLLVGALGALPYAMGQLDWAQVWSIGGSFVLYHATGVAGACGWLALLALVGGGPREAVAQVGEAPAQVGEAVAQVGEAPRQELGAVRSFLSAIGRRSMTAYLSQTLLFAVVFLTLGLTGVESVGVAVAGLIALGVWAVIGIGCVVSDVVGATRGPAERVLRWLVARTASALPLPALPVAPMGPWGPMPPAGSGMPGAPFAPGAPNAMGAPGAPLPPTARVVPSASGAPFAPGAPFVPGAPNAMGAPVAPRDPGAKWMPPASAQPDASADEAAPQASLGDAQGGVK